MAHLILYPYLYPFSSPQLKAEGYRVNEGSPQLKAEGIGYSIGIGIGKQKWGP
jgi:hypothetical protein